MDEIQQERLVEVERGGGNLVFVDLARFIRGGRYGIGLSQGVKILLEDQGDFVVGVRGGVGFIQLEENLGAGAYRGMLLVGIGEFKVGVGN